MVEEVLIVNIIRVLPLAIPEIILIAYERFSDSRGYFTETFRTSDIHKILTNKTHGSLTFSQGNESFSKKGTIRGLHFQWNPFMGKLVRVIDGSMVDFALDIRIGSPTLGKIIACQLKTYYKQSIGEWIWIPSGFAHGGYFLEDSVIEYLCTGEYNSLCETGISIFSDTVDWSFVDKELFNMVPHKYSLSLLMSDKDRKNMTLEKWLTDPASKNFVYGNV